ncbi:MAG: ABC transporter permease [Anaerolineales bacterium]|nr:ABC transporter permease [Anaerolineales bacterium]
MREGQGTHTLRRPLNGLVRIWTIPASLLVFLLIWSGVSRWSGLPAFMLPSPGHVWNRFLRAWHDGSLLYHTGVTLTEVASGLFIGMIIATVLGYLLAKSPTIEQILSPYIVASQAVPTIAIAPLLIIWFGPGRLSKVLISALIVFFPILINTVLGLRSVSDDLYDLMDSLRATPYQVFSKLEFPAALPVMLGGLKVGATLSVIGAVVGEFVGSDEGLGFLINVGRGLYDTALVFVAVFALIALALLLYGAVILVEKSLLKWQTD